MADQNQQQQAADQSAPDHDHARAQLQASFGGPGSPADADAVERRLSAVKLAFGSAALPPAPEHPASFSSLISSDANSKEISPPMSIQGVPAPAADVEKQLQAEAGGDPAKQRPAKGSKGGRCGETGRKVSLTTVLVGLLVVQVIGAALVTWGITWYFSNRNLEELARRVVEEVERGVRNAVYEHLSAARFCADRTREDLESGRTTLEQWRRTYETLHHTLVACPQLQRLAVGFGNTPKTRQVFAGYRCYDGEENCPTQWHAIQNNISYVNTYAADSKRGQPVQFLFGAPYGVESGPGAPVSNNVTGASWSDIFIMAQLSATGQAIKAVVEEDLYKRLVMILVEAVQPTADVNLLPLPARTPGLPPAPARPSENATYPAAAGFVRATVSLSALSAMLRGGLGRPYPTSIVFVTNTAGYMVASSVETLVAVGEPNGDAWKRMRADTNPSEVIRDVYAALGTCEGKTLFVRAGGRQHIASCSPLDVPPNLSWRVFTAVPTDESFGEFKSSAVSISCANAGWLVVCIVVSVSAGMLVTRPLAKLRASILQLTKSIEGVSKEIKRNANREHNRVRRSSSQDAPAAADGGPASMDAAGAVPVRSPTALQRIRGWLRPRPALGRGTPDREQASAAGSGNESDATDLTPSGSSSNRSMVLKTGIAELSAFSTLMRSLQSRFVQFQRLSSTELELLKTLLAERKTKMEMEVRHEETRKFLATMSHEMRTPLNGVLGMLYLARDCSLPDDAARCVDDALVSGEHLLALVNDVLDIQKVEAGLMELQIAPTPIAEAVQGAVRIVQPRADAKGLRLEVLIDPCVPAVIHSDADRLRQILLNLLTNAVKYSDRGTITVRVAMAADERDPAAPAQVRFSVTDQGPGIPAPAQQQLFCRFYRVRRAVGDGADPGGTGLGLAICKEICRVMGGSVGCVSAPHQGSEFFFLVPLSLQAAPPHRRPSHNESEGNAGGGRLPRSLRVSREVPPSLRASREPLPAPAPSPRPRLPSRLRNLSLASSLKSTSEDGAADAAGAGVALGPSLPPPRASSEPVGAVPLPSGYCNILVAEDNAVNARVVVGMLEKEKHHVALAHDGAQAIEMFEAAAGKAEAGHPVFDLILMDCSMPVVDGYAATEAIRRCEAARSLPRTLVAALTAHASKEDEQSCRKSGMDLYLTKPIRKPQLLAAVGEARLRSARLRHEAGGGSPPEGAQGGGARAEGAAEGARLAPPEPEAA